MNFTCPDMRTVLTETTKNLTTNYVTSPILCKPEMLASIPAALYPHHHSASTSLLPPWQEMDYTTTCAGFEALTSKVTLLQAYCRGWLQRKKYRTLLASLKVRRGRFCGTPISSYPWFCGQASRQLLVRNCTDFARDCMSLTTQAVC